MPFKGTLIKDEVLLSLGIEILSCSTSLLSCTTSYSEIPCLSLI